MSQDICEHCKEPFSRYKNRKNQSYCSKEDCQKARKANWKREKAKKDTAFKQYTRQVNRDWRAKSAGYYKAYRKRNPDKAERNRILQRIRNQKRKAKAQKEIEKVDASELIAKVDVLKTDGHQAFNEFWLVPVIAKVDVLKAYILFKSDKSKIQADVFS